MGNLKWYHKLVKEKTGYNTTNLPTATLRPGDIGTMSKGTFHRDTSLKELSIKYKTKKTPVDKNKYNFDSNKNYSINSKNKGEPNTEFEIPISNAGLNIKLNEEKTVLFQLSNYVKINLENMNEISEKLLSLYQKGKWKKQWYIVTEIIQASKGAIIISNSAQSQINVIFKADVKVEGIELADIESDTYYTNKSGDIIIQQASADFSPLFLAYDLKTTWIDKIKDLAIKIRGKMPKSFGPVTTYYYKSKRRRDYSSNNSN